MADWKELIHFTTAIFVITNPIGVTPIFLSMTAGQSQVS
jgi:small neutral amino acid transporter SnatA (MarC family)